MKFAFNMLIVSEEINFVPHSGTVCGSVTGVSVAANFSATREIQLRIRNIHVLLAERSLGNEYPSQVQYISDASDKL